MKKVNKHFREVDLFNTDSKIFNTFKYKQIENFRFKTTNNLNAVLTTFSKEIKKIAIVLCFTKYGYNDTISSLTDFLENNEDKLFVNNLVRSFTYLDKEPKEAFELEVFDSFISCVCDYLNLLMYYRHGYYGKNRTEMFKLANSFFGEMISSYYQEDYVYKTNISIDQGDKTIKTLSIQLDFIIHFADDIDGSFSLQKWFLKDIIVNSIVTDKPMKKEMRSPIITSFNYKKG